MNRPTIDELRAYAKEIGFNNFDAGRFLDYWEMRGWMMRPGIPMKSWQAAVRTWRRNQNEWSTNKEPSRHDQRDLQEIAKKHEERHLKEYADRLIAVRSWYDSPEQCPYGDPEEEERRLVAKIKDNFGTAFLLRVYDRAKKAGA
jgi:hypothetical protein